ncbi:hypothetical protein EDD18DRAFT_1115658 [Armillaria luteobubalina]|uniref:Uncharacterized protein n=1 Tax=Armillaria luteobubalina TaxID=153913 RepID=A0AA39TAF8_9AGAR|nr:hypothetical protein EDD18DRAFT_1115658 [Armillaria luteobubalina]
MHINRDGIRQNMDQYTDKGVGKMANISQNKGLSYEILLCLSGDVMAAMPPSHTQVRSELMGDSHRCGVAYLWHYSSISGSVAVPSVLLSLMAQKSTLALSQDKPSRGNTSLYLISQLICQSFGQKWQYVELFLNCARINRGGRTGAMGVPDETCRLEWGADDGIVDISVCLVEVMIYTSHFIVDATTVEAEISDKTRHHRTTKQHQLGAYRAPDKATIISLPLAILGITNFGDPYTSINGSCHFRILATEKLHFKP